MHMRSVKRCCIHLLAGLLLGVVPAAAQEKAVSAGPPDLTKGGVLARKASFLLGPTGAHGNMYTRDYMTDLARQILITKVDAGTPADGVLEAGDVILGIADKPFTEDPRRRLGRAITQAETQAGKGILKLLRWRPFDVAQGEKGKQEVVSLKLRVLGTFSETAPYNCPKSKRIMDEALRHLADRKTWSRFSQEALAYLASGRPEYISLVREHIHEAKWAKRDARCGNSAWNAGYRGLVLTEYYLATGDKYVLPIIREYAVRTAMGQGSPGTWGHRFVPPDSSGRLHGRIMGYGGLNCAGLPCFLSLVLAKKCGVNHPEVDRAIERSSRFFSQFVGRGSIGYGFHRPSLERRSNGRNALSSNGKNGTAAVAFTVLGHHEVSRYFSKLVTSSYDEREYGHSGNSYGYFWGPLGANCGGPKAVAAFLREQRWYSALTRKADGSFVTQPLGGYYGGRGIMDATVAHVLANALPMRKLYITGKAASMDVRLSDAEVDEAIDAGRWRRADYDKMSAGELIDRLGSWSPAAREWIAEALGRKKANAVGRLLALLKSSDGPTRAGACTALGYQGTRAAGAVGALTKALSDEDSNVRVAAGYALMQMGPPGRKALPDMLKAVVAVKETQSMRPTQMALAYSLGHAPSGTAPLYFTGMLPNWPEGQNPLEGLDRTLLYPAMRRMLRHSSARVRGCGAYAFKYFTAEDVGIMAQDIHDVTRNVAPHFPMFGDTPRQHGLDLMVRFRFREGLALCLESLDLRAWGRSKRFPHRLGVLKTYRGAAKPVLPALKELRWHFRTDETRGLLEEAIKAIENDRNPPKLTSLADLVDRRVARELATAKSTQQRAALCRKRMTDHPGDTFVQAAGLRQLVSMLGPGAFDDLLAAIGHSEDRVRAAAIELAAELPGRDMTGRWVKQLPAARGRKLAGILAVLARRGDAKTLAAVKKYLKHEEPVVQVAAVEAVSALGGQGEIKVLVDLLVKAEAEQEREVLVKAVVAACRRAKDIEKSAAPILAVVSKGTDTARCSAIRVLGELGGAKATATAVDAASDENADVRKAALDVLARSPDPKVTDILLTMAEKAGRGRAKGELALACVRRAIIGRVPSQQKLGILERILPLGGSAARMALDELAWPASADSLRMARCWMRKRDRKYGNLSKYAGRAAVAVAQGMDMSDSKQRQAAVEAVKEALTVTKDKKTAAAAEAFIAKHGGDG